MWLLFVFFYCKMNFPHLKKKKKSKNPKNLFDQKFGRKLYSILGGIYPIYGITWDNTG